VSWKQSEKEARLCECPSVIGCKQCEVDIETRHKEGVDKVTYECRVHGGYRKYEDGLMRYKVCKLSRHTIMMYL